MRNTILFFGAALLLTGCEIGAQGGGNNLLNDPGGVCTEGPLGPAIADPGGSGMEACCQAAGGEAHCVPTEQMDAAASAVLDGRLDSCASGGLCVPDSFIKSGGSAPPQTCSAFGGDGVCLSICIPEIAANPNVSLLQQGECAGGDELCVPCINPLDGTETGACALRELATCEGTGTGTGGGVIPPTVSCDSPGQVLDASSFPSCGAESHCIPEAAVAGAGADLVARLAPCADVPGSLCVPDIAAESGGFFTLNSCTSVAGAEGRCASLSLPEVAAQADLLPQGAIAGCGQNEACAPCYSPVDGSSTGVCDLACDTGPVQAPIVFDSCEDNRGSCVPSSAISAQQQESLGNLDCDVDGDLCVPSQVLNAGPFAACSGTLLGNDYQGTCNDLSVLTLGIRELFIPTAGCDDIFGNGYKCVPCEQNGTPTGAPGCDILY